MRFVRQIGSNGTHKRGQVVGPLGRIPDPEIPSNLVYLKVFTSTARCNPLALRGKRGSEVPASEIYHESITGRESQFCITSYVQLHSQEKYTENLHKD